MTTVLVASLCVNVVLARRVYGRTVRQAPIGGIKLGEILADLPITRLDGREDTLHFRDPRPMLVYVMSPTCGWCKRNYNNIRALASAAASKYRIIGISNNPEIEKVRAHLAESPLPFDVFVARVPENDSRAYLFGTPSTLLLTPDGKVEKAWVGAYMDTQPEIEATFAVRLPGLTVVATTPPPR